MRGFCFLGRPEGRAGKRHLKIILTEPNQAGFVVIASVTSLKYPETQGASCILRKGYHPFIRHDSIVDVDRLTAMHKVDILRRQYNGELISKEELESAVLGRVLQAARASRKMQPRIKAIQRADTLVVEAC